MVPYLRAANVKPGALDLSDVKTMNFTPSEQQVFSLQPGDVLVTEGAGSLRAVGAAAVWHGGQDGVVCFQNTLVRLRPRKGVADARFLAWWAQFAHGDGVFAAVAGGVNIFHLGAQRVSGLRTSFPPLDEQRRIADHLAAETARIDALIAKRQRQIELLDERDLARVWSAITGREQTGPRTALGPSWLGATPDGWPVASLGTQFEVTLGRMLNAEREAGEDQRPYIRNVNVRWDVVDLSDVATMNFPAAERLRLRLRGGDVVVNEGGAGIGRTAIWRDELDECYFQKSVLRLRPLAHTHPAWIVECMRVAVALKVFLVEGNTATIPHVPAEALRAHRFPFPPAEVQAALLDELHSARTDDRALTTLLNRQIGLLRERRQAMITAAVTGELVVS
ncbi:hypothetical protein [Iamia sp.]|uniref:restriction endonuclease subunit S n=1 Tax=Iamia sp. TaxID=2722710 RepID=UPI002C9B54E8|nr:hypothetical protein [Iamia sp.]HXH57435.1 hypothetical protein [Iamia sp.]